MHPVITMKHWSHHLHDGMLNVRHRIAESLHSRHFWIGVGVALVVVGIVALLILLARDAPFINPYGFPYSPYGV